MKALVFTDKEQLEYQSVPSPTPKGEELLVKVSAAGICGSDMHAYHGFDDRRIPPLILGHEISGTIENSKENVIINPLITCGNCYECKNGIEHLCQTRSLIGMSKPAERHGGFAEFVSVPKKNLHFTNKKNISIVKVVFPCIKFLSIFFSIKLFFFTEFTENKKMICNWMLGLFFGFNNR